MKILFVIPARGGSKGIPGKNIKHLGGKPLIHYSLEYARLFTTDSNICLTTDSFDIAACAKQIQYQIPFLRPDYLAADTSGTYEVLQHALNFYDNLGRLFDVIILLQPTSPFREKYHVEEALKTFEPNLDMVVSVFETASNPYYNLFEENQQGYLQRSKGDGSFIRRQDIPPVYEFNGSIYIISAESLRQKTAFKMFTKIKKYVMSEQYSIDLDTQLDWQKAEWQLNLKNRNE